jgi:hypothetical protein
MSWHVDASLLEPYAAGDIDEARAFSVEAHLMGCESCRFELAQWVAPERLERVWEGVEGRLDPVAAGPVERLLRHLGVPEHAARLLAATPSLRLSWFAAVAAALAFAVGAGYSGSRGLLVFLILAPLVPVAGVGAAYGPRIDPTYEIGVASPMRSFRLLLIRASAVLAASTALSGVAALTLPGLDWSAAAWLLPSLALTASSLALSAMVSPILASAAVAIVWTTAVLVAEKLSTVPLAAFRASGQVALLVVAVVGLVVLAARRESFDTGRPA